MIQGFADRKTERFFEGQPDQAFDGFADQATHRLTVLDNAASLQDMAGLRSNRLKSHSAAHAGEYSIRINRQWRICFRWAGDGPYDVETVDHGR